MRGWSSANKYSVQKYCRRNAITLCVCENEGGRVKSSYDDITTDVFIPMESKNCNTNGRSV